MICGLDGRGNEDAPGVGESNGVIVVGTWGIGPFDNDTAADFAYELDDADLVKREALIRVALLQVTDATGYLYGAQEAVAAAALIAAQCPGGEPIEDGDGPEKVMPVFPDDLRELAVEALDRIVSDEFGLVESWVAPEDGKQWLSSINRLRAILAPPLLPDPLFEIE